MRGGALFNGKEGRGDFRKSSTGGRLHPLPFWKGRGLGSGLRTLPQGFLSPTRGTEGGVKTIEKAWLEVELSLQERRRGRKYSTADFTSALSVRSVCE